MNKKANPPAATQQAFAFVFDGKGRGKKTSLKQMETFKAGKGQPFGWVHLHRDAPETEKFLQKCKLTPFVIEALTADETRPRCTPHKGGVMMNLRGVNLNPGSEPEDMISVRLWLESGMVISVRRRKLVAVRDLFDAIDRKQAPTTPGDLVAKLALRLADRAEPTVAKLNEQIDTLEEDALEGTSSAARSQLADIRRTSIVLRRYMFPQRDALTTLQIEDLPWLTDYDRGRLREAAERVTRLGEELDAIRDRALVINDQIMDKRAETMNNQMLILSVVAAIFLPLGLLTGLLGINVGGIPGGESPWGFWFVTGLLVVLGILQFWVFKKSGLLK